MQPNWYYNLADQAQDSPLGYLLQCLLETRMRLGMPSDTWGDETTNVYLGHLLVDVMTSGYHERSRRYVAPRGSDIFHQVEDVSEPYEKFLVYRTNADHRLLSASVFRPTDDTTDAHVASCQDEGRTYYHFAAAYNQQLYRKTTALAATLNHLSDTFAQYGAILQHMRHAYFHLWKTLDATQFDAAIQQVASSEQPTERERLMDAFLDAYRTWRGSHKTIDHDRVQALARALTALDPDFRANVPNPLN